jgi:uncharacterized membrane protein YqjE
MNTHSQSSEPAQSAGTNAFNPLDALRLMRSAGGALFAQASLHTRLARVEWAEEKTRLMNMAVAALAGFAFLLCFLVFAGVLAIAFTWDTQYRFASIAIVLVLYAVCALIAWGRFHTLSALGDQAFAATREEIAIDIALIKSKL